MVFRWLDSRRCISEHALVVVHWVCISHRVGHHGVTHVINLRGRHDVVGGRRGHRRPDDIAILVHHHRTATVSTPTRSGNRKRCRHLRSCVLLNLRLQVLYHSVKGSNVWLIVDDKNMGFAHSM